MKEAEKKCWSKITHSIKIENWFQVSEWPSESKNVRHNSITKAFKIHEIAIILVEVCDE